MKIGVILLCRYNSSRLYGKILMSLPSGETVLSHIINRLNCAVPAESIVVATSQEKSDDIIVDYCYRKNINVYRGSLNNVSERFLNCGKYYGCDYIVRINGDNFFTDFEILSNMINIANLDKYDLITNVPKRTFPYGMSVEILRTSFLEKYLVYFSGTTDSEHVTSWFYKNPKIGKRYVYKNELYPAMSGINLALDTAEDFKKLCAIKEKLEISREKYGLSDIYNMIFKNKT